MSDAPRVSRRAVLGASYAAPTLLVLRPMAAFAQSPGGGEPPPPENPPERPPPENPQVPPAEEPNGERPPPDGPSETEPEVPPAEEPSEPGAPTEPGSPTDPGGPTDPGSPTEPGAPTEPDTPSEPATPPSGPDPDDGVAGGGADGGGRTRPTPGGTVRSPQTGLAMTGMDALQFLGLGAGAAAVGTAMVRAGRPRDDAPQGVEVEEDATDDPTSPPLEPES